MLKVITCHVLKFSSWSSATGRIKKHRGRVRVNFFCYIIPVLGNSVSPTCSCAVNSTTLFYHQNFGIFIIFTWGAQLLQQILLVFHDGGKRGPVYRPSAPKNCKLAAKYPMCNIIAFIKDALAFMDKGRLGHEKGGSPEVVYSQKNEHPGSLCETDGVRSLKNCVRYTVWKTATSACDSVQPSPGIDHLSTTVFQLPWSCNTGATLISQRRAANDIAMNGL